jgi:hypothetical protein
LIGSIVSAFRSRRRLLGAVVVLCASATALVVVLASAGAGSASGQVTAGEDVFQTDNALPAIDVLMFGSSPEESPGETWGIGRAAGSEEYEIVRYASGAGWTLAPAILDSSGEPLSGFKPDESVLAGSMTPHGAGALVGFANKLKVILVRAPGQAFQETSTEPVPEESEEALLAKGEELFSNSAPFVAAIEEGTTSGAFVLPARTRTGLSKPGVLHWEGAAQHWSREPIELPEAVAEEGIFEPLGIAASSPTNAWLLARISSSNGASLFRRQPAAGGSPARWVPVKQVGEGSAEAGSPLTVDGEQVSVKAEGGVQALTATGQGVWVDGKDGSAKSLTLFFKPSGEEAAEGQIEATWCNAQGCTHTLPEELPNSDSRSYAWESSSRFGERVITGFANGVLLRMQAGAGPEEFTRLVTVGSAARPEDVGATKGAAFSSPLEGWLGNNELPVHVTLEPVAENLYSSYWPAPFDKPLLAIAPEPGAPVAAISSEALAVGEHGEVGRYIPGEGWQPETLFEPSGIHGEPQLRAVAWPTSNRAYAVGVNSSGVGEIWLWRGETGLWEPDAATPINLRADLLGIAFAPGEPSRGYIVGQSETLLRYSKTWTQETSLPAEVSGASFTSVAFAGSEALVAYRVPHIKGGQVSYTGGVLANSGSGWQVDTAITAALPENYIPWAVAGLTDGSAAVSASVPGGNQRPIVLERDTAAGGWEATPQPYPGLEAPASLALFHEGSAIRVIGSGVAPDTVSVDDVTPPPAGFPPNLLEPYPLGLGRGIERQTAASWSDEEPERRVLRAPEGGYTHFDIPYSPDPTAAILISEDGSTGWAVGGLHEVKEGADSADIARFPSDGSAPPGIGKDTVNQLEAEPDGEESQADKQEPIPLVGGTGGNVTFAVGGGSQCASPCSALGNDRIGPDVWLTAAIKEAEAMQGVQDFLYTGPRVTAGVTTGRAEIPIPYTLEFERYESLLSANALPTHIAPSITDREDGSECGFDEKLKDFLSASALEHEGECSGGQSAYYTFSSGAPPDEVEVIVIDDSKEVESTQLSWIAAELRNAASDNKPAIVVGNADLPEEADYKHEPNAEEVARVLVAGNASAYLFDDPEKNAKLKLTAGAGAAVPAFGSGTLGYVNYLAAEEQDFIGASGFLLVVVEASRREASTNRAPVIARLMPAIGELSLDAQNGTLLKRSQAAMFSALARRPRAGGVGTGESAENESANFVPIPAECEGGDCPPAGEGILPEYKFESSAPKVGEFVKPNLESGESDAVLLGRGALGGTEEPIPDSKSGLFCAYNKGVTKVRIDAGGLYAELQVEVQAGSVRRPCGTTPVEVQPAKAGEQAVSPPVQPAGPAPAGSPAAAPLVPVPPLPAPTVPPPPPVRVPAPVFFPPLPLAALPPTVIVPPPLPPVAEPTPPSGTSAVTSPVEAAQREEEHEEATEQVSAQAVAYDQREHEPDPVYLLGLIMLAALAGATIRSSRRGRRAPRVAHATISATRSQRRMTRSGRRPPW